jgi:hypothetical protein
MNYINVTVYHMKNAPVKYCNMLLLNVTPLQANKMHASSEAVVNKWTIIDENHGVSKNRS